MLVLVCGGRAYEDYAALEAALDSFNNNNSISMLVHGDAKGADRLAGRWATFKGIHQCKVPALWKFYGNRAGSNRNSTMLQLPVTYCIAFPGGAGTSDMVKQCEKVNIPVWRPYDA